MKEVESVRGSIEYLYADLRADDVLDTQAVSISISPTNAPGDWTAATWVGNPGKVRTARVLLDGTLTPDLYHVFARITDAPEAPIISLGRLKVV